MTKTAHDCHLAQDLLIPYLAGDVSTETRSWLEAHLADCEACAAVRQSLVPVPGSLPPAVQPTANDPGRQVVRRVRRQVWLVVGLLALFLGFGIAGVTWGISSFHKLAKMPEHHPVPAATVAPETVAERAATVPIEGLAYVRTLPSLNGAHMIFQDEAGHQVTVDMRRWETPALARDGFDAWFGGFRSHMLSVELQTPSAAAAKFRSGPNYYYGWRTANWTFIIQVPSDITEPATVRDAVRDGLFAAILPLQ